MIGQPKHVEHLSSTLTRSSSFGKIIRDNMHCTSSLSPRTCTTLLHQDTASPSRRQHREFFPNLHEHRWSALLSHISLDASVDSRDGSLGEFGLIVALTEEVRVNNGRHEGVLPRQSTNSDAQHNQQLRECDRFHGRVIIG